MEKWSFDGTSEYLGILKCLLYFEKGTTLYTYKNDELSFITEALVSIKLKFVTQNTHTYTHFK